MLQWKKKTDNKNKKINTDSKMETKFWFSLPSKFLLVCLIMGIPAMAQTPAYRAPRLSGHPDLNGIWQAMNTANWDLLDHPAQPSAAGTIHRAGTAEESRSATF